MDMTKMKNEKDEKQLAPNNQGEPEEVKAVNEEAATETPSKGKRAGDSSPTEEQSPKKKREEEPATQSNEDAAAAKPEVPKTPPRPSSAVDGDPFVTPKGRQPPRLPFPAPGRRQFVPSPSPDGNQEDGEKDDGYVEGKDDDSDDEEFDDDYDEEYGESDYWESEQEMDDDEDDDDDDYF